jgi:hypothetical protein
LDYALEHCLFLRHCREQAAALPEPLWYAMITNLAPFGPDGEAAIHDLSRPYPRYTARETDAKIAHARRDAPGPHTCQTIADLGWRCPLLGACPAKAPAALAAAHADARRAAVERLTPVQQAAVAILPGVDAATRRALQMRPTWEILPGVVAQAARGLAQAGFDRDLAAAAILYHPLGTGIPAQWVRGWVDVALGANAAATAGAPSSAS